MLFRNLAELVGSGFHPRVTIVGSGPAGLSLALRLQSRQVPCLVIEAGGYEFDPASQDIYRGRVIGDDYFKLHEARLRQFGGTSGHWSGWVAPLEASDFDVRPWVPHSGWPIVKTDLDGYASDADRILEVVPHVDSRPATNDIDVIQFRFSPPVRFGFKYREEIEQSPTVGLLLKTAVKDLIPDRNRIRAVTVTRDSGQDYDLPVENVCLCTGGIENSRLLLWSNARHDGLVVKQAQTLGRYWMEHLVWTIADAITFQGYEMQFESQSPEKPYFAPSERAKRTFKMGGSHIWLRAHATPSSKLKDLWQEAMCLAPDLSARLLRRLDKEVHCGAQVLSELEQWPRADNRIELDQLRDRLGVPRPKLFWRKFDSERQTARMSARLVGAALIKQDIGRLRMRNFLADDDGWPLDGHASWHHMGGTRMADSPDTGVVDRNCKVFGMDNLFVGGSSVFATGGHANPTYTIVQLALRLGDHLASFLAKGGGSPQMTRRDPR